MRSLTRRQRAIALFLVGACALAACNRTPEAPPEGPLAYQGFPQSWTGAVALSQPRAWGLIRFGRGGLHATVTSVTFGTPLPDGLATRIELNAAESVPIGAPQGSEGMTVHGVPGTISGVVQIVVWFEPSRLGIEYFSRSTTIRYSIEGQEYVAHYPVGVGICSVQRVTATTPCDVGPAQGG
jgi:hypothetical protein